MNQAQRAEHFRALHTAPEILVLLNAWDVASARILAGAGCAAVGTTSMGVAAVAGLPDEQEIELDAMLAAVSAIAGAIDVPLTADMEAGYGTTTEEVVAAMHGALDAGAVGVNIEDGTGDPSAPLAPPELLAERIAAIRAAVDARGVRLVINARTDVFLRSVGAPDERLARAIERGNRYRAAGADCVFVPGGLERETIRTLAVELDAPLNVVANPAISVPVVPPIPELQELGVARVSVGSGLLRSTLALTLRVAREALGAGTYERMAGELAGDDAPLAYELAIGRARRG